MKMIFKILNNPVVRMVCDQSAENIKFVCNTMACGIKFITTNASKFITCALDIFCSDDLMCGEEEYIVDDSEVK